MYCKNCQYSEPVTSKGYCRSCAFLAMKLRITGSSDAFWALDTIKQMCSSLVMNRWFYDRKHSNDILKIDRILQIGAN